MEDQGGSHQRRMDPYSAIFLSRHRPKVFNPVSSIWTAIESHPYDKFLQDSITILPRGGLHFEAESKQENPTNPTTDRERSKRPSHSPRKQSPSPGSRSPVSSNRIPVISDKGQNRNILIPTVPQNPARKRQRMESSTSQYSKENNRHEEREYAADVSDRMDFEISEEDVDNQLALPARPDSKVFIRARLVDFKMGLGILIGIFAYKVKNSICYGIFQFDKLFIDGSKVSSTYDQNVILFPQIMSELQVTKKPIFALVDSKSKLRYVTATNGFEYEIETQSECIWVGYNPHQIFTLTGGKNKDFVSSSSSKIVSEVEQLTPTFAQLKILQPFTLLGQNVLLDRRQMFVNGLPVVLINGGLQTVLSVKMKVFCYIAPMSETFAIPTDCSLCSFMMSCPFVATLAWMGEIPNSEDWIKYDKLLKPKNREEIFNFDPPPAKPSSSKEKSFTLRIPFPESDKEFVFGSRVENLLEIEAEVEGLKMSSYSHDVLIVEGSLEVLKKGFPLVQGLSVVRFSFKTPPIGKDFNEINQFMWTIGKAFNIKVTLSNSFIEVCGKAADINKIEEGSRVIMNRLYGPEEVLIHMKMLSSYLSEREKRIICQETGVKFTHTESANHDRVYGPMKSVFAARQRIKEVDFLKLEFSLPDKASKVHIARLFNKLGIEQVNCLSRDNICIKAGIYCWPNVVSLFPKVLNICLDSSLEGVGMEAYLPAGESQTDSDELTTAKKLSRNILKLSWQNPNSVVEALKSDKEAKSGVLMTKLLVESIKKYNVKEKERKRLIEDEEEEIDRRPEEIANPNFDRYSEDRDPEVFDSYQRRQSPERDIYELPLHLKHGFERAELPKAGMNEYPSHPVQNSTSSRYDEYSNYGANRDAIHNQDSRSGDRFEQSQSRSDRQEVFKLSDLNQLKQDIEASTSNWKLGQSETQSSSRREYDDYKNAYQDRPTRYEDQNQRHQLTTKSQPIERDYDKYQGVQHEDIFERNYSQRFGNEQFRSQHLDSKSNYDDNPYRVGTNPDQLKNQGAILPTPETSYESPLSRNSGPQNDTVMPLNIGRNVFSERSKAETYSDTISNRQNSSDLSRHNDEPPHFGFPHQETYSKTSLEFNVRTASKDEYEDESMPFNFQRQNPADQSKKVVDFEAFHQFKNISNDPLPQDDGYTRYPGHHREVVDAAYQDPTPSTSGIQELNEHRTDNRRQDPFSHFNAEAHHSLVDPFRNYGSQEKDVRSTRNNPFELTDDYSQFRGHNSERELTHPQSERNIPDSSMYSQSSSRMKNENVTNTFVTSGQSFESKNGLALPKPIRISIDRNQEYRSSKSRSPPRLPSTTSNPMYKNESGQLSQKLGTEYLPENKDATKFESGPNTPPPPSIRNLFQLPLPVSIQSKKKPDLVNNQLHSLSGDRNVPEAQFATNEKRSQKNQLGNQESNNFEIQEITKSNTNNSVSQNETTTKDVDKSSTSVTIASSQGVASGSSSHSDKGDHQRDKAVTSTKHTGGSSGSSKNETKPSVSSNSNRSSDSGSRKTKKSRRSPTPPSRSKSSRNSESSSRHYSSNPSTSSRDRHTHSSKEDRTSSRTNDKPRSSSTMENKNTSSDSRSHSKNLILAPWSRPNTSDRKDEPVNLEPGMSSVTSEVPFDTRAMFINPLLKLTRSEEPMEEVVSSTNHYRRSLEPERVEYSSRRSPPMASVSINSFHDNSLSEEARRAIETVLQDTQGSNTRRIESEMPTTARVTVQNDLANVLSEIMSEELQPTFQPSADYRQNYSQNVGFPSERTYTLAGNQNHGFVKSRFAGRLGPKMDDLKPLPDLMSIDTSSNNLLGNVYPNAGEENQRYPGARFGKRIGPKKSRFDDPERR